MHTGYVAAAAGQTPLVDLPGGVCAEGRPEPRSGELCLNSSPSTLDACFFVTQVPTSLRCSLASRVPSRQPLGFPRT